MEGNTTTSDNDWWIQGVVYGRSVRSSFCSLHLASLPEDEDGTTTNVHLLRIQFHDNCVALRAFCRRFWKLGDLVQVRQDYVEYQEPPPNTGMLVERMVLSISTVQELQSKLQLVQNAFWPIRQCQELQNKHYLDAQKKSNSKRRNNKGTTSLQQADGRCNTHAKNGLAKREQAAMVSNFLLHMMVFKGRMMADIADSESWVNELENAHWRSSALQELKRGVLDVAGGSGYISMALSLRGIQATCVDPRPNVGKLPKRDRQLYSKSLYCQPVFQVSRMWFGEPPENVDTTFRNPDEAQVPVLLEDDIEADAIVAFHPDEATETIVRTAVRRQIPFVVVPCCVFHRLFPNRRKPDGNVVSTYQDLLEYLQAIHPSIQSTKLPFPGSNVALWSVFSREADH